MRINRSVLKVLRYWDTVLVVVLEMTALLFLLNQEVPPPGRLSTQIDRLVADKRFNFTAWELQALWGKVTHALIAPQRYMNEPARSELLLNYLNLVDEIRSTEWEIYRIYTDPKVEHPEVVAQEQLTRLASLRQAEEARQLLAEAILEEQAGTILISEGFGALRLLLPPVSIHFTPLPTLLVVSPRERIERIYSAELRHGLDASQREAIESEVDALQNVSSLVTDVGGLSSYPSMLLEDSSILWLTDVTVHEWTHHYLLLRPLGWNYEASPETRTINETVASIVGHEAGRSILARYYPAFLPDEQPENAPSEGEAGQHAKHAFDFRQEMHKTRVHVDALLAEGKITEAEDYMEQRRQEFVAHGYYIRKLNQAYFAFHGAYADEPGAAGEDPVGPAVKRLRALIPDLHTFVVRVARVTRLSELEALIKEMEQEIQRGAAE